MKASLQHGANEDKESASMKFKCFMSVLSLVSVKPRPRTFAQWQRRILHNELQRAGSDEWLIFPPIGGQNVDVYEYSSWKGRGLWWRSGAGEHGGLVIACCPQEKEDDSCFVFTFPRIDEVCRRQHGDEEADQSGAEEPKPRGGAWPRQRGFELITVPWTGCGTRRRYDAENAALSSVSPPLSSDGFTWRTTWRHRQHGGARRLQLLSRPHIPRTPRSLARARCG